MLVAIERHQPSSSYLGALSIFVLSTRRRSLREFFPPQHVSNVSRTVITSQLKKCRQKGEPPFLFAPNCDPRQLLLNSLALISDIANIFPCLSYNLGKERGESATCLERHVGMTSSPVWVR